MLKISLLSLVRSKGRTLLFTLLIIALTLVLSLGINVWAAIDQFFADADDFYTTVAFFEFIGADYPQDTYTDPAMVEAKANFDRQTIINDPATFSWQEQNRAYAFIEGYNRNDNRVPNKDDVLIVVRNPVFQESYGNYSTTITELLFGAGLKDDQAIILDKSFGYFEPGHTYVIYGEKYNPKDNRSGGMLTRIRPKIFDNKAAQESQICFPNMYRISSFEGDKSGEVPEVYRLAAQSLEVVNHSVVINSVDNLETVLPFHQEELYLIEGRSFSDEEYRNGEKVVLVPDILTKRTGKTIGDTLNISINMPDSSGSTPYYWAGNGFVNSDEFTIVGIFNTALGMENQIYVPRSAGVPSTDKPLGYTLGWAVLDNAQANDFYLRIEPKLQNRILMTVYDQGYADIAMPFQNLLGVAQLVTIICALVELVVLIFFGYVFVYRQRETGQTMLMLGTDSSKVIAYFLLSSSILAIIGTLSGAYLAYRLSDQILAWVAETAAGTRLIDGRYSNSNLSFARSLEFSPQFGFDFFLKVALIVFVVALISCVFFIIRAFALRTSKQRSTVHGQKGNAKTSTLTGGSGKYALLSVFRGGMRSIVVVILATAVVLFFGQLASTSNHYQTEMTNIYQNTSVEGRYTDVHGKQVGNQVINSGQVLDLFYEGKIDRLTVSRKKLGLYLGTSLSVEGEKEEVPPFVMSFNQYVFEAQSARFNPLGAGFELVAINDIYNAPEFYYSENVLIDFLDGYDAEIFASPSGEDEAKVCVVSSGVLEKNAIRLGDTIKVAVYEVEGKEPSMGRPLDDKECLVIGTYPQESNIGVIYTPLSALLDTATIWGENTRTDSGPNAEIQNEPDLIEANRKALERVSFNSATFVLNDARELGELKDYLTDYGYSQVNHIGRLRTFVVLNDATLNQTIASVQQQLSYINRLYPVLIILSGIIALVVSWLLGVNRRIEMATMQGLGASKTTIFMSFFLEQIILCFIGVAIGLGIWFGWRGSPISMHWYLVLGFIASYLLGSAISIISTLSRNLLSLLAEKE